MMKENRFNGIPLLKIILFTISIIGILYLIHDWRRRGKTKKKLISLLPLLEEAANEFNKLVNLDLYFDYSKEQDYYSRYKSLLKNCPNYYHKIGLNDCDLAIVNQFVIPIRNLSAEREHYNNLFIKKEAVKYAELFNTVAGYPLSADQIEAILRDEDNNLVIAGAGTGKTTTISAKVAYILTKGLATPDELLIIAFTKNAANEMFERTTRFCSKVLGDKTLDVRTFNSFGYMVLRQAAQSHFDLAFDGDEVKSKAYLQTLFDQLFVEDENFQSKAVNFIVFFNRPPRDQFSFETGDEYIKNERNFRNVTLNGVEVKSKEEVEIGNFFYLFNINFEYEFPFPLKPEDTDYNRGQYKPDFYLKDHDIWHEHYGIDENGNVPNWFSYSPPFKSAKEYYHSIMNWKEAIHTRYQTKLVKTYSYQNKNNQLIPSLKKQLLDLGVELKRRDPSEILEVIQASTYYEDFMNLVYVFLNLMKSNNKNPDYFKSIKRDKRLTVFMDVFKPIYQRYQSKLSTDNAIDFNDMINEATKQINQNNYKKQYKYILVDEFQDMSIGRYELLLSLKKANQGVKLFGVGDDWQSIYRFTGSDISITTLFPEKFGYTQMSTIFRTFRFNNEILQATSSFVQRNPSQIKKELKSDFEPLRPSFKAVGVEYLSENREARNVAKIQKINEIIAEIETFTQGNSVYLIGRYHHNKPFGLQELRAKHRNLKIEYYTAHGVKGLTCDFAILLDIDAGKLGFPSEVADDPILNHLLFEGDNFENAEERRVFYVALTRARHRNYILFNNALPSKFLDEIISNGSIKSPYTESVICPKCKGRMVKRHGPRNAFYGCLNYPHCDGIVPFVTR